MAIENTALREAARRLEQSSDRLVADQLRVLKTIPSYSRVPRDELERATRRNVLRVVASLRGETSLPAVVEDERASGRRRALQGIPAEEVVAAYRAVIGVLRDAFLHEVADVDIPTGAVLVGIRRLWDLTDHFSSELVSARHQVDLDLVRREERERQTFLHNWLTGTLRGNDIADGAGAAYGIDNARELWVARARSRMHTPTIDLIALIERATRIAGTRPLVGLIGGDVVGITATRPSIGSTEAVVAIEGPVLADGVRAAFNRATALLEVGDRYDLSGVVTAEMLSLRVAVAQNEQLGRLLTSRYVESLGPPNGMTPLILESVRMYLEEQRSIPAAARRLNVHVNTLRYRLERFQALTGADLRDTVTLIEVWWALQYERFQPSETLLRPSSATVAPITDAQRCR